MTSSFAAEALRAYDEQVRRSMQSPQADWTTELAAGSRVLRTVSPPSQSWGCFVIWSDLDETDVDEVIAEQVAFYAGLGRAFEWKWHGYDEPANLPDRLAAAGFVPAEQESLVIGRVDAVVDACAGAPAPTGVTFRHLDDDDVEADLAGIAALNGAVWGDEDVSWLMTDLAAERVAAPERLLIHVAEAHGEIVCAAWVRLHEGTDFASLWGGSTLPEWRRKGIYRALVARRAEEAQSRGYRYLQVDASDDSLPILERLGLEKVTVTTPYNWRPPS